jgi:uncharacterized CHY-type Zn-finger protein
MKKTKKGRKIVKCSICKKKLTLAEFREHEHLSYKELRK